MNKADIKNPLSRSIIIGSIVLVLVLSIVISSIGYRMFRKGMYVQYESHLGDVIKLVEAYVDVEDVDWCLKNKKIIP